MANKKKDVYKVKPMTAGKRNIIQGLLDDVANQSCRAEPFPCKRYIQLIKKAPGIFPGAFLLRYYLQTHKYHTIVGIEIAQRR